MYRITVLLISLISFNSTAQESLKSPMDTLPSYIRQLTFFGERADWSLDSKKVLFLEKTFGDVFEVDIASGELTHLTHHYFHEGYVRALYLSNGDVLLSGAPSFDANNPWESRDAKNAELWVLKRDLSGPPIPLGIHCKEGPAVSRSKLRIAWTLGSTISYGEIKYNNGKPGLVNVRPLFKSLDMPAPVTGRNLETQGFRPPDDEELVFNAFGGEGVGAAEVMGFNLRTRKFTNYSKKADSYDEPEGFFPDGLSILVESNRHRPNYKGLKAFLTLDIYELLLDETGTMKRITYFNDNPEYKASNPVISDDGKFIAFQYAHTEDAAGMGRGILLLDVAKWRAATGSN